MGKKNRKHKVSSSVTRTEPKELVYGLFILSDEDNAQAKFVAGFSGVKELKQHVSTLINSFWTVDEDKPNNELAQEIRQKSNSVEWYVVGDVLHTEYAIEAACTLVGELINDDYSTAKLWVARKPELVYSVLAA